MLQVLAEFQIPQAAGMFPVDNGFLKALVSNNRTLSKAEEESIKRSLAELERHFLRITGAVYDAHDQSINGGLPDSAQRLCSDSIRLHRHLLSSFRTFPMELLQRIFASADLETPMWSPPERPGYLATLSLVCRQWREAAISHCALWTELPVIHIYASLDPETDWKQGVQDRIDACRLYIARGGSLPLTIHWSCQVFTPEDWEQCRSLVEESLDLLTGQCRRWGDVTLMLPYQAIDYLAPVHANLPQLQHLNISIKASENDGDEERSNYPVIDYFSNAPALRSTNLNSEGYRFILPISHLERVALTWDHGRNSKDIYKQILESQSPSLRSFTIEPSPDLFDIYLPSFHCTLPNLTELDFTAVYKLPPSFARHLGMLTLPSLTTFRLPHNSQPRPPSDVWVELLNLICRSGCVLEVLSGGSPLPACKIKTASATIFDLLGLSSGLTRVRVGHIDGDGLRRLVLDPSSPHPILPNLEELSVDHIGEADFEEDGPLVITEDVDVHMLMEMVDSRRSCHSLLRGEESSVLKEVVLSGYDIGPLHRDLSKWEMEKFGNLFSDSPSPDTVGEELVRLVLTAQEELATFSSARPGYYAEEYPAMRAKLSALVSKLEALDFETLSASIISRGNLPYVMRAISTRPVPWDESPEMEALQDLDRRISALLKRWKPFIIRDARLLPYRWKYAPLNADPGWSWATLRWWDMSHDDDVFWEEITTNHEY